MASRHLVFPFSVVLAVALLGVPGAAQQASPAINSQHPLTLPRAAPHAPQFGPGDLDPSFGTGGKVVYDIAGTADARTVVALPDGKIFIAGGANAGFGGLKASVRLLPDGSLDPSFGSGGREFMGCPPPYSGWCAGCMLLDAALRPDGGIAMIDLCWIDVGGLTFFSEAVAADSDNAMLIAGHVQYQNPRYLAVVRRLADGSLDPQFGSGGIAEVSTSVDTERNAILVQPGGKVLVAGQRWCG
jgi:uncharacterized delta-60 repeat protein